MPDTNGPPSHFTNILLSNWQSAVSKVVRSSALPTQDRTRPPLDFNNQRIQQAAAAAAASGLEDRAKPPPPVESHFEEAKNALDAARALMQKAEAKTAEELAKAEALLEQAKFGNLSPFWLQCITEFLEHYTLTKHASVPYIKWVNLADFVLPNALPSKCRIALIGDWGTAADRAQALLTEIGKGKPDILVHLGDIYYSCTASEANAFYDDCKRALPAQTRIFTLCGNHDMYAGAAPYYALLKRIGQPASFFCLRNQNWQILAGDTGYNDFKPMTQGADATWIRDRDEGDNYSELDWHRDKLINVGGRRTILLTHHQLFTRNASINHEVTMNFAAVHNNLESGKKAVNAYLMEEFADFLPDIALWVWGHEHNQVIYAPFAGLNRGRCVGASAIPVPISEKLYDPSPDLTGQNIPELVGNAKSLQLQPDGEGSLYQLGYAILELDGKEGKVEYFQFDPTNRKSTSMYKEDL